MPSLDFFEVICHIIFYAIWMGADILYIEECWSGNMSDGIFGEV